MINNYCIRFRFGIKIRTNYWGIEAGNRVIHQVVIIGGVMRESSDRMILGATVTSRLKQCEMRCLVVMMMYYKMTNGNQIGTNGYRNVWYGCHVICSVRTMSNAVAIRAHTSPGDEIILERTSHAQVWRRRLCQQCPVYQSHWSMVKRANDAPTSTIQQSENNQEVGTLSDSTL